MGLMEAAKFGNSTFTTLFWSLIASKLLTASSHPKIVTLSLALLFSGVKTSLRHLQHHVVGYSRKQVNHVAHTLTSTSRLFASHHIFHLIPTCIESFLLNEMA